MKKIKLLALTCMLGMTNAFAGNDDVIAFQDPEVERICVETWDFNKDGKFTYGEAAAVATIGTYFAGNYDIETFNEFQYFTSVESTEEYAFEGCGSLREITLPPKMEYLAMGTFVDCASLTNVKLNDNLKFIDEGCFAFCVSLEQIELPESIEDFGAVVFIECSSLKSISIPKNVEYIRPQMFTACSSLETVTMYEGIKGIGESAFEDCVSLKNVKLPASLEDYGKWVFWNCYSIEKYEIAEGSETYAVVDGVLYTKDMKQLLQYPAGCKDTEFNIPETVDYIGFGSFEGNEYVENIHIPESVILIDNAAFYRCSSLKSINMPDNVKEMGNQVFYGCVDLTDVSFPKNIAIMGSAIFANCQSITEITIPEQVKTLEFMTFAGCISLKQVNLPENIETIDQKCFMSCNSLESIIIPKSVTYLGPMAFFDCPAMNNIKMYSETGDIDGMKLSSLVPTDEDGNFIDNERIIYVPTGCKAVYEASDYWSHAMQIKEFDDVETAISVVDNNNDIIFINGVKASVNANDGLFNIYTADGVLYDSVSTDNNNVNLPSGIYIINGKKIIVR